MKQVTNRYYYSTLTSIRRISLYETKRLAVLTRDCDRVDLDIILNLFVALNCFIKQIFKRTSYARNDFMIFTSESTFVTWDRHSNLSSFHESFFRFSCQESKFNHHYVQHVTVSRWSCNSLRAELQCIITITKITKIVEIHKMIAAFMKINIRRHNLEHTLSKSCRFKLKKVSIMYNHICA